MSRPALNLSSSALRCVVFPLPADPYVSFPGLDFARVTSSCSVFAEKSFGVTRISGADPMSEIGVKSLYGFRVQVFMRCGLTVNALSEASQRFSEENALNRRNWWL